MELSIIRFNDTASAEKENIMMKHIAAVLAAVLIICASCMSVFAAGINAAEQSVLANMNTPANMNGNSVYVPANYLNQAEAHFNTIEMTDAQASEINGYISAGRSFLEGTGKSSMQELSSDEVKTIISYANSAAGVLNLSAAGDENSVKVIDDDGEVVMDDSGNIIKATGGSEEAALPADYTTTYVICAILAVLLFGCVTYTVIRRRALQYEEVKH